jgi:hypothetical protein
VSDLDRAITIAISAHAGQVDMAGQPYILHPLRVMMRGRTEPERIVGVLHDVAEDCPAWPLTRLCEEGFGGEVEFALTALTRQENENYAAFIDRIAQSTTIARQVKVWDLYDNCNLSRLSVVGQGDLNRVAYRYLPALVKLRALLPPHLDAAPPLKL